MRSSDADPGNLSVVPVVKAALQNGLCCLLLVLGCAPAVAQYVPPQVLETGLPEEEQERLNDRSLRVIVAQAGVHLAAIPIGFIPEPITSYSAEISALAADNTLKFTKAVLRAPDDVAVLPNTPDECSYSFTLPQATLPYQNFLGLWPKLGNDRLFISRDQPADFGILGVPDIRHANTDVILSVFGPSAGISHATPDLPQTVIAEAGIHNIEWRADTQYFPMWDLVVPTATTAAMIGVEFKFAKHIKKLKKARSNTLELASVKGDTAALARKLDALDAQIGLFEKLRKYARKKGHKLEKKIDKKGRGIAESFHDGITTVSRSRYQRLTVYDVLAPSITTSDPAPTFEATDIGGARTSRFLAALQDSIHASDACGRTVIVRNDLPEFLPLGETLVTWTVRDPGPAAPGVDHDGDGTPDADDFNSRTITQTVTIEDTQAPIMVPPPGLVIESDASIELASQPLGQPLVVDLADLHPAVEASSSSTDVQPDTRTVVTWSATDASGNETTAEQLVTVKTPGTNTPPMAFAETADTLTSQPVDIVLTGLDNDVLPLTGAPGGPGLADPLQFRIETLPENGEFVAPLLPFFIDDYRTDTTGVLSDDVAFAQAPNQLAWLDDEYCENDLAIPVNFVFNPLFVQVTDEGERYFLDHYAECGPFDEPAVSHLRISRWSEKRQFLGHIDYNPSGGVHTASFVLDRDGNIYYLLQFGVNDFSLQQCDAEIVGTTGTCSHSYNFDGNVAGFSLSSSTYALVDSGATGDSADPLIYLTDQDGVAVFQGHLFKGHLLNDAGQADFLEDQVSNCQAIPGGPNLQGYGMALDSAGNFYIADTCGDRVHKFSPSSLDEEGNLVAGEYVGWMGQCSTSTNLACDDSTGHSKGFSCTDVTCSVSGDGSGSGIGQFTDPVFLAMDPNDVLYVADYGNQRIQRFAPDGTFAGQAKSTGNGINAETDGSFILGNMGPPRHVSVNSDQFFVVDQGERFVHVFDTSPFKDVTPSSATVSYVSNFAFHSATDTFAYSVNDGLVDSSVAPVSVTVNRNFRQPLPTPPPEVQTDEDHAVVIVLSGSDPDGIVDRDFNGLDSLDFVITQQPASGSLEPGGDPGDVTLDPGMQAWTYTPNRDFHGTDSFSFTVRDEFTDSQGVPEPYGEAEPVEVAITVHSVNDVPIVRITEPERVAAGFPVMLQATAYDDISDSYAASVHWGDGEVQQNGETIFDDNGTPNDSADDSATLTGVVFSLEGLNSIGESPLSAMHTYATTGARSVSMCLRDAGLLSTCDDIDIVVEHLVAMGVQVTAANDEIVDGVPFDVTIDIVNQQPSHGVAGLDADNVILTLEVPAELVVSSHAASQGSCSLQGAVLDCALGTLANASSASVSLTVRGSGLLVHDRNLSLRAIARTDTPSLADASVGAAVVDLIAVDLDRDGDGLSNIFEARYGVGEAGSDEDGDGLDNLAEFAAGTSPVDADSDEDGISDGDETGISTDPLTADSDGDGLSDGDEITLYGSNPLDDDSDGDELPDQWEVDNGYDPLTPDGAGDADDDGLSDADEFASGSDPLVADTDGDGLPDGDEVNLHQTSPALEDSDDDGFDDGPEVAAGTDPLKPDSDDDGLLDGAEVSTHGTDPLVADSDRDGLPDGFEVRSGRDPLQADYALAAGGLSSCALTDAGVECWGRNDFGQAPPVVAGLDDPQQVTVGFVHACAIDRAGDGSRSVTCWGDNTYGQSTPPPLNDPLYVAAGSYHTCALDRSGTGETAVLCWGRDNVGQVSGVPTGLENPVRLVSSISGLSSCVLDDTATGPELACWGQYNNGNSAVPAGLGADVGALALGSEHGCVMDGDERLCWGLNDDGQAPPGPVAGTVTELSLGGFHSCALVPAGMDGYSVDCWGLNVNGQADVPATLVHPIGLASGSHHSCALDGGSARCWGVENQFDQGQAPDTRILAIDPDGDGLPTAQELLEGTDPLDADSDRDGLQDAAELINGTDPRNADSDDDGLRDGDEIDVHATDPLDADTDDDGMPDGWEVEHALQPMVADASGDSDGDGLSNAREHAAGADPNEADSDGDGLGDAAEVLYFRYRNSDQALGSAASEAVELGDLDSDGDLDAFVANRTGGSATWTNDGGGLFSRNTDNALNDLEAVDVDLADIDGDGDLDAVLAHPVEAQSNTLWINGAAGDPEGLFSDSAQDLGPGISDGVAFGQFSPPFPGLFVANWGRNQVYHFADGTTATGADIGDALEGNSEDVAVGDLNGDAADDAFVVNRGQPNQVFLSFVTDPFWFVGDTGQALGGDAASIAAALGDLDGDGDLDAYEVVFGAGDRIWLNDGAGNFADSSQALGNDGGNDVSLLDVEGDGDLDAFVANTGPNKLWLNAGDGTMFDSGLRMGDAASFGLSLGDVDGDGDTDVFVANEGPNAVWLFSQLDPGEPDSDGDGTYDGWELDHGFDPLDDADGTIDSDGDGLSNVEEFDAETDPLAPDTDGDGMPDGFETANGLDPLLDDADLDLDRDGVTNLGEYQSGGAVYGDDVPPELSVPSDVSADSTGQFTAVELGSAVAVDARDGTVAATADDPGPFQPGAHVVTWSANDLSGNLAQGTQGVGVVPQVSFATDQTVDEGDTALVVLALNGPAVNYPVQVNYTVTGTASNPADHDAAAGSVMIDAGTSSTIPIHIVADAIFEGEETFTLTIAETVNAIPGPQNTHTISITQANVMPLARIVAEQQGRPVTTVATDAGPVTIHAEITDPNSGDSHSVDWSGSDSGMFDPADANDESYSIDPSMLSAGFYRVAADVMDSGVPIALNRAATLLRVIASAPILSPDEDSDGDGIDDATEGSGDSDGDRVPDHLDAFPGSNVLAYAAGNRVLETQTGLTLRLGETAFRNGALARVDESTVPEDVAFGYPSGVADFEILGIEPGATAAIVLPLEHPVPESAVVRKLVGTGWQDFVIDTDNRIASAPGSDGACPAPGSGAWVDGLTIGHGCLQLTLQDGGPNDADFAANGVIRDPGGLAVPVNVTLSMLSVADREVAAGSTGNVILAFSLASDSGDVELDALTLAASGTGDDTAIAAVSLYVDMNGDGAIDGGDKKIASGVYSGDDGTLAIRMATPFGVPPGRTDLLVAYDF